MVTDLITKSYSESGAFSLPDFSFLLYIKLNYYIYFNTPEKSSQTVALGFLLAFSRIILQKNVLPFNKENYSFSIT